jgi:serine acetyltransferase
MTMQLDSIEQSNGHPPGPAQANRSERSSTNSPGESDQILDEISDEISDQSIGLWAQIVEDWNAHGRDWTRPGFRAVAIQRFGVWRMGVEPKALRAPLSILYRMLFRKVRNHYGIELPFTVKLGRRVVVEHQGDIVVHGYCQIGDDSIIRQGVTLGNRYMDRPFEAPHLGRRVNVGAGAKLFGAIHVEDDVNIGANAVVLTDIPAGATAVGIPARILPRKPES